jgi:hypothetical protein
MITSSVRALALRSTGLALAAAGLLVSTPLAAHDGGPLPEGHAPAGVMVDHLHKAGEFMVGYRYGYFRNDGDYLHGTKSVDDHTLRNYACVFPGQDPLAPASNKCRMKQKSMTMHMHMLDIMYAPTDWLTLMVMPMWMSMDMTMTPVAGGMHGGGGGHGGHMGNHSHGTEDFGDTIFGALIQLSSGPGYNLHTGLMVSAPTGPVDKKSSCPGGHGHGGGSCFEHYMMQIGSGTWDFMPSLTYTGRMDRWSWGSQIGGVLRLEDENESGYRLGDVFYATAWGSYRLADWISASVRLLHTQQGEIEGHYNGPHKHGSPPDLQYNYGGRFWDIGFGINTVVPSGPLQGHRLGIEWLEPIEDDVNGYQQERDGTLWVNWSKAF